MRSARAQAMKKPHGFAFLTGCKIDDVAASQRGRLYEKQICWTSA
jgi:hypothetical protein